MIITNVEPIILEFPSGNITRDAIHTFGDDPAGLAIRLESDDGVPGWGYIFLGMIGRGAARSLATIVRELLAPAVVGQDAHAIPAIRRRMWERIE
jgi:L-alanine-DL-glutamate epimerase-like enolase superfamily enzyme